MSNGGADIYTDSMKQLLSQMMSTPYVNTNPKKVTASSPKNADSSRSAAPNPPLAPMTDLTSTIANLNVYESSSPCAGAQSSIQQLHQPIARLEAQQQRHRPKPQPIQLQRRDNVTIKTQYVSPNDFSVSPSVLTGSPYCLKRKSDDWTISPRFSPHERFLPERKRSRFSKSPVIEGVELFAVLVDICDAGTTKSDQQNNRGNN
jgi:hypothetical protein